MPAKMYRATKGTTANAVTYSSAAATYGVCLTGEMAMYIGSGVPARTALGHVAQEAIYKALETFLRAKKPAAPGAGNLKFIYMDAVTLGLESSAHPQIADVANATAVNVNRIGILIGNTMYASIEDSAVFMRMLDACIASPAQVSARKKA